MNMEAALKKHKASAEQSVDDETVFYKLFILYSALDAEKECAEYAFGGTKRNRHLLAIVHIMTHITLRESNVISAPFNSITE